MKFQSLYKLFAIDESKSKETYLSRFNSEATLKFFVDINEYPSFGLEIEKKIPKEDFEKVLLEESKSLNLDFSKEQIKNFYDYMIGVLEWNDKINVTAITDENNPIFESTPYTSIKLFKSFPLTKSLWVFIP